MRTLKDLQAFWLSHIDEDAALCTIVRKTGSGYRGPGAKKIIVKDGHACGYLSGGCLEGEIAKAALDGWHDMPFIRSFSTMSDEDRLMGYQTGCAGVIDILFEHLPQDRSRLTEFLPFGPKNTLAAVAVSLSPETLAKRTRLATVPKGSADVFIDAWVEPLTLCVLGCGPNASTFVQIAGALGWNLMFLDYRKGNEIADTEDVSSRVLPLDGIGAAVPEGARTAVIIMTHNYEADMAIISQLNGRRFGYIGCVGPRKRFDQICRDLKDFHHTDITDDWAARVRAPAGLKQGHTTEEIAFSIIAEIQFGLPS